MLFNCRCQERINSLLPLHTIRLQNQSVSSTFDLFFHKQVEHTAAFIIL